MPTDEQIAKTKAEFPDYSPGASFNIRWEPLSYKIEGGPFGNEERDRVPVTHQIDANGVLTGLTPAEIQAVRENGWMGLKDANRVNQAKVYSLPRSYKTTRRPYDRLMGRVIDAGIKIAVDQDGSVTGTPGQIYTPSAGTIFITEAGMDDFPLWDATLNRGRGGWKEGARQAYMRYPVKADPDYIIPDNVPVSVRNAGDGEAKAAPTTAGQGGAGNAPGTVDVAKLREAAEIMGMLGAPVTEFDGADRQRALVARAPMKGAVIFGALGGQAAEGKLIEFLEQVGAVTVENGVLA